MRAGGVGGGSAGAHTTAASNTGGSVKTDYFRG